MTLGHYTGQDHADEMREDARPYIPPCDCCGKPTERGDFLSCRHWCCEECSATAWPLECLACLRWQVGQDGFAFVKTWRGEATWWAGPCAYPTCSKSGPHEHLIGLNTVVTQPMEKRESPVTAGGSP